MQGGASLAAISGASTATDTAVYAEWHVPVPGLCPACRYSHVCMLAACTVIAASGTTSDTAAFSHLLVWPCHKPCVERGLYCEATQSPSMTGRPSTVAAFPSTTTILPRVPVLVSPPS